MIARTYSTPTSILTVEKSNVSVSHAFATVVLTSTSEVTDPSAFSTLNRTGTPERGEYTCTLMVVAPAANGIGLAKPSPVPMTVPAKVSAPAPFVVDATVLFASVGSATSVVLVPLKSITV